MNEVHRGASKNEAQFSPTALVSGLIFIVLGLLFLLEQSGVLDFPNLLVLPILLIGIGAAVLLGTTTSTRTG